MYVRVRERDLLTYLFIEVQLVTVNITRQNHFLLKYITDIYLHPCFCDSFISMQSKVRPTLCKNVVAPY